jgi:hypothetical protein
MFCPHILDLVAAAGWFVILHTLLDPLDISGWGVDLVVLIAAAAIGTLRDREVYRAVLSWLGLANSVPSAHR